jgi:glycosyltransferase involved in cell wall biosynthesis
VIVDVHPADNAGCCAYRCRYPADVLAPEGIETRFSMEIPARHYPQRGARTRIEPFATDADLILWQRPLPHQGTVELMEGFQRQGVAIVVDIDDDFTCPHPSHPLRARMAERRCEGFDWRWLGKACALADLLTVSTPSLAERYGAHGRVQVIRNCVPAAALELPGHSDGRTAGWSGIALTHPGDLEVTHGGVQDALADSRWRFHVVGSADHVQKRLGLADEPTASGIVPTSDWLAAVGALDIGIVPLGTTRFNAAKSYLKGLEYAARGVPFVASPLPEYQRLANQGVGLLAPDRGRSWRSRLRRLMDNEGLRTEMAAHGRHVIAERHTYEDNSWRWAEAWEKAIENRRSRSSSRRVAAAA